MNHVRTSLAVESYIFCSSSSIGPETGDLEKSCNRGLHSSFSTAVFERFQPRFQFRFRYTDLAENGLLL